MHPQATLPSALLALAVLAPGPLAAQQAWKAMIVIDKPVRAVPPTMSVDTQRVTREADGTYSVFLRWSPGADAKAAPRTDRIERHRLDCRARQSTYRAVALVPIENGKEPALVHFPDGEARSVGFPNDGPEREFFASVCRWAERAAPGSE